MTTADWNAVVQGLSSVYVFYATSYQDDAVRNKGYWHGTYCAYFTYKQNFYHNCGPNHIGLIRAFCSIYRGAVYRGTRFPPRMDLRGVFATNLRRLRNARGLSQDELAYEAEVSRSYLSQLEKGAFYASLKVIGKLAKALNAEPFEFLKPPLKRSGRG